MLHDKFVADLVATGNVYWLYCYLRFFPSCAAVYTAMVDTEDDLWLYKHTPVCGTRDRLWSVLPATWKVHRLKSVPADGVPVVFVKGSDRKWYYINHLVTPGDTRDVLANVLAQPLS
jgi:hypothetical protein